MKKFLLIVCFALLLVGCSSAAPAATPTPEPTNTPLPPTDTPTPTDTPLPTATPQPTLTDIVSYADKNNMASVLYLLEVEGVEYSGGYYRWAIGLTNVIIEYWAEDFPDVYMLRAESYMKLGDFEQGITDLETAYRLPSQGASDVHMRLLNNLCWNLGLTGEAERALPYCEEGVAFAQENNGLSTSLEMVLDSRGVVYAQLGMIEEAAADFQVVIPWLEDNPGLLSQEETAMRQEWLSALENGENPITPEVLEGMQSDVVDPLAFPQPNYLEDYSRSHFVEILENDGFFLVDSGTNDNGVEYVFYGLAADECMIRVIVFGPEEEITEAKMILSGCDQNQYIPEFRWFVRMLLFDNPRDDVDCILMGEYYAWELLELQTLIDGDQNETVEFQVGGLSLWAVMDPDDEGKPVYSLYGW